MKRNVYLTGAFLISSAVGFGITTLLKTKTHEEIVDSGDSTGIEGDNTVDSTTKQMSDTTKFEEEQTHQQTEISTPKLAVTDPVLSGKTYFFSVSCSGVAPEITYHYELWSTKLIAKSHDGVFRNVPASSSGTYKLCLVDNETGANLVDPKEVHGFLIETKPKQGVSVEEFQSRMLTKSDHSLDGGKKSLVSRSFRLSVVGMHDDEENKPTDIQGIKDKIEFGIWSSAKVVGELTYDANGLVTSATVSPVY